MAQRQGVLILVVAYESEPGNFRPSTNHIMDRVGIELAKVRNVHMGYAWFDESDHRLRRTELTEQGEASPELKKLMDVELAEENKRPA